ncbi:hypothetical protein [Paenibacillus motobuensis]|uniref:hypothetical protein n=1 Tax=Paenibacillus motobuensis TaxID=295324 RepID=UPI0031E309E4
MINNESIASFPECKKAPLQLRAAETLHAWFHSASGKAVFHNVIIMTDEIRTLSPLWRSLTRIKRQYLPALVDPSILQLPGAFPPRGIEITSSPRR